MLEEGLQPVVWWHGNNQPLINNNTHHAEAFAAESGLLDAASCFRKKRSKKFTFRGEWSSNRTRRWREYDHILVKHSDRRGLQKLTVIAETKKASDHNLVLVKMRMQQLVTVQLALHKAVKEDY